ncbi:DNA polymeras-like protein subunit POLD2 [Emiliania huxleyi CCMP1516]|uniref:DNA polymerase delta small subunit n=2 Tax=Emiliania huxleyi TaxID=2903 RepID=A0A0D3K2U1_EMIH1|nr:DNA polymeras-like protein subunit POLD2 [Emiliania huxleyi CCMP1516]EOD30076.1 DNA polymeras-like protein subunit POLD2 [Emiliania huxleyi CCMP1516]|eukprot:XP_005782505.1 DNA polymeras-like protein subunit POLD2 [Emiliania huxleyi CCMP1516]
MPRKVLTRATATVDDAGAGPFRVEPEGLTGQFANLYFTRLGMLSPVAREAAASAWGGPPTWVKALDAPANGETVAVVGTLFAELSNKPDIDKGLEVAEAAHGGAYVGGEEGTDSYCLEDESGRLQLGGVDKLVSSRGLRLVTGAVIAVRGVVDQDGVLTVGDVVFPGAPPAAPSAASAAAEDDAAGTHAPAPHDKHLALVSGLRVGQGDEAEELPLTLLSEWLTGHVGGGADLALQASVDPLKKVGAPQQRSLAAGMAALDAALSGFGGAVPVDLMPGATDPAGHLLPQQPMHPCMLPQCSRLSTAAAPERALDALEMCLELRHDPFLLDASPAVFFAGNQPAFATRLFRTPAGEPVRLVAVPDFRETRSIVLVNLRTLDAHTVSFAPEAA